MTSLVTSVFLETRTFRDHGAYLVEAVGIEHLAIHLI
jgi:hypothetical protein